MPTGLYIHIPFCASRCIYCGFYSTTMSDLRDRYTDAVCREMEMRRLSESGMEMVGFSESGIRTIYLGGGTPSQLTDGELRKIFSTINNVYFGTEERLMNADGGMEITMECNPDDITPAFCKTLQALPVNRISMGAQTFSDPRLRFLHRRHTSAEVALAVERLRVIGIGNISIDLMFGFPGETLDEWNADIDSALKLGVEHISAYSLQYEEGTPLFRMLEKGDVSEIDDELYRSMYSLLCDRLGEAGYEHYEISNFARPGFRSRHNSSYWHDIPYIGIGASAHSYTGHERSWNVGDITKYISSIERGVLPSEGEIIDEPTHYDDTVMTSLRTREGIDISRLTPENSKYLMRMAEPYVKAGEMKVEGNHLSLTREGIFVSDMIMGDLMRSDE